MIKDRIELAQYMGDNLFRTGAEIGVADGRYSEILFQNIPGLHLYGVDPYAPYEGNWRSAEYQENACRAALQRLKPYNFSLFRNTSLEAASFLPDKTLDFVFIDGDHTFNNVMLDILLWTPKVRKGGIVSGHDYYNHKAGGVIPAINAYCEANKIDMNLTLKGVAEHKDDQCPCWWFIKQ